MSRIALIALPALALAGPALAQTPDPHAHHHRPAPAADSESPPRPANHAAERFYPAADMAAARAQLRREHGGMRWSTVRLETGEYRPSSDGDAYAWEGRASYGGDMNRALLKTEGQLGENGRLHDAEIQALYTRAVTPYFNLNAGLRYDLEPDPGQTYATLGIEGVAPYWLEVEGALFLSERGDLSARIEGAYDLRLTQRLILEPRAELDVAARDVPELGVGSGLSSGELGLRLRYAVRQELAPYVGVHYERKLGRTADRARAAGEADEDARLVFGIRAWF